VTVHGLKSKISIVLPLLTHQLGAPWLTKLGKK